MFNKLSNFFQTNDICDENDIMYIVKTKGTQITEFHLTDGRTIIKYISLRDCKAELSSDIFYNITKGVLININHVKCINRRTYHMKDGEVFLKASLKDINFINLSKKRAAALYEDITRRPRIPKKWGGSYTTSP